MPNQLARIKVQVNSLARPEPKLLLRARAAIKSSSALGDLFLQAKAEGWPADQLADRLAATLPDYIEFNGNIWDNLTLESILKDTSRYLADEFLQIGDSLLLISLETGEAIAKVTDEDIYVPAPVSRETSVVLAQPLPRLNPALEGLLVEWSFTKGKEDAVTRTLASRVHQTDLLRQEGDNRLRIATMSGRQQLVAQLRQELQDLLTTRVTGQAKEFLSMFQLVEFQGEISDEAVAVSASAKAKVVIPLTDKLTLNLQHDPYTTLVSQVANQWVRDIAWVVGNFVHRRHAVVASSVFDAFPAGIFVADPNAAMALRPRIAFPVPGAKSFIASKPTGLAIGIEPSSFRCESREFLDRWETSATMSFVLIASGVSGTGLLGYNLTGVPNSGIWAEVV